MYTVHVLHFPAGRFGLTVPGVLTTDVEAGRVEQFLPLEVQYVRTLGPASSEE